MKAKLTGLLAVLGFFLLVGPAFAHHPFAAEFDKDKPVHLTGTVSKLDWTNPHASLILDAKDSSGHVTNWTFELGGPNALKRRGWTRNTLKTGDQVTVVGWQAKDGRNHGNANTVMLSTGKELDAASSFFDKASTKDHVSH